MTPPPCGCQRRLLFAHLYRTARTVRIPFHNLLWVVRQERGEKFGRPHYHALIGWKGDRANIGQCFALNSFWNRLPKCGFARHFVYEPGQDAVGYITKGLSGCLSDQGRDYLAASNYEASKFGLDWNEVEFSKALLRSIGRQQDGQTEKRLPNSVNKSASNDAFLSPGASKPARVGAKTNREVSADSIVNRSGNWQTRRWV